jgi:hypothetical protein
VNDIIESVNSTIEIDLHDTIYKVRRNIDQMVPRHEYMYVICNLVAVIQNALIDDETFDMLCNHGCNLNPLESHYRGWANPDKHEQGCIKSATIISLNYTMHEATSFAKRYPNQTDKKVLIYNFLTHLLEKMREPLVEHAFSKYKPDPSES